MVNATAPEVGAERSLLDRLTNEYGWQTRILALGTVAALAYAGAAAPEAVAQTIRGGVAVGNAEPGTTVHAYALEAVGNSQQPVSLANTTANAVGSFAFSATSLELPASFSQSAGAAPIAGRTMYEFDWIGPQGEPEMEISDHIPHKLTEISYKNSSQTAAHGKSSHKFCYNPKAGNPAMAGPPPWKPNGYYINRKQKYMTADATRHGHVRIFEGNGAESTGGVVLNLAVDGWGENGTASVEASTQNSQMLHTPVYKKRTTIGNRINYKKFVRTCANITSSGLLGNQRWKQRYARPDDFYDYLTDPARAGAPHGLKYCDIWPAGKGDTFTRGSNSSYGSGIDLPMINASSNTVSSHTTEVHFNVVGHDHAARMCFNNRRGLDSSRRFGFKPMPKHVRCKPGKPCINGSPSTASDIRIELPAEFSAALPTPEHNLVQGLAAEA